MPVRQVDPLLVDVVTLYVCRGCDSKAFADDEVVHLRQACPGARDTEQVHEITMVSLEGLVTAGYRPLSE
jgi:hypothetical protein